MQKRLPDPVPKYAVGDFVWEIVSGEIVSIADVEISRGLKGKDAPRVYYRLRSDKGVSGAQWQEEVLLSLSPPGKTEAEMVDIAKKFAEEQRVRHEAAAAEKEARWAAGGRLRHVAKCVVCGYSQEYLEDESPKPNPDAKNDPRHPLSGGWSYALGVGGSDDVDQRKWTCSEKCIRKKMWQECPLRWKLFWLTVGLPLRLALWIPEALGEHYCPECQPGISGWFRVVWNALFPSACSEPECGARAGAKCKACRKKCCLSHAMSGWHEYKAHGGPKPEMESLLAHGLDPLGRTS